MKAKSFEDLLKKGDRIAVSNITGREANKVSINSQLYCGNVVGGWALGKAGRTIPIVKGKDIPVFGQFEDMMRQLPTDERPNKIIVYSPPEAVYGDVKEVIEHGTGCVETMYVITENVSVEVTAKLRRLCNLEGFDIIGCNTLGIINVHDKVRIGAVGGDAPEETFTPGSACILSNSGNMVNTIATYLKSAGLGISYGIATGKDALILSPLKKLLVLAEEDPRTKVIILYIEPGGTYEREALEILKEKNLKKPLLVYVAGSFADGTEISLGHAGAVVAGGGTSATEKMKLFDDYFEMPVFEPIKEQEFVEMIDENCRGLRVNTLHDIVSAANVLMTGMNIKRDMTPASPLALKPWLVNLGRYSRGLSADMVPHVGEIIEPFNGLIKKYIKSSLGRTPTRQSMRNASHASSNDGVTPRVFGYSLPNMMKTKSFAEAAMLYWLGCPMRHKFESELIEMCLIASLSNGPGTISAQGAKLSASAGNPINAAMMTTLGSIGDVHGGNGSKAARLIIEAFSNSGMTDPYDKESAPDLDKIVRKLVSDFKKRKAASKEAGIDYDMIPCLGHPVFNQEPVNYDPRERVIFEWTQERNIYNVFFDFYHRLTHELHKQQATNKVHAVNVDAAITCVLMGVAWPLLAEKKMTVKRAIDLPFLVFSLGRVAGGAGEYLDHRESGTAMDMRIPITECRFFGREQD